MTDDTVLRVALFLRLLFLKADMYKANASVPGRLRVAANHIHMLIVREVHRELGDEVTALPGRIRNIAEAWKEKTGRVARANVDMTVRADQWSRPFPGKELLAMTTQTGRVFGKFGHIGERNIRFTYVLPILSRKLVAGITAKLLRHNMCAMRKA